MESHPEEAPRSPKIKLVVMAVLVMIIGLVAIAMWNPAIPRDRYAFLRGNAPFGTFREFGGTTVVSGRTYTWQEPFTSVEKKIDSELMEFAKTSHKVGADNHNLCIWKLPGGRQIQAVPTRTFKDGHEVRSDWVTIMIQDFTAPSPMEKLKQWLKTHWPI
ncbi:MAG: hypothetical protein ABL962_15865 [Fimbriimonadaceae bacterium]